MKACELCGDEITGRRLRYSVTRFCSEKCRLKAVHKREWKDGGWIKAYHTKNREQIAAKNREWRAANPEKLRAQRLRRRDKRIAEMRAWRARNPERVKQQKRESAKRHPGAQRKRFAKWLAENGERNLEHKRKWRKENPAAVRASRMARYASQTNGTPAWLTRAQKQQILQFYKRAAQMTRDLGMKYEVDHIVPIRGRIVCGLHVPWNLQILTRSENAKKHNKFVDETPDSAPRHQAA
jgi:hypothetical protein